MSSSPTPTATPITTEVQRANARYWRRNLFLTLALLVGWFLAGLGCGVLFAEPLNEHRLGGFPLGFWFAQQGAIIAFVVLILIYAVVMGRLDRAHRRQVARLLAEDADASSASSATEGDA